MTETLQQRLNAMIAKCAEMQTEIEALDAELEAVVRRMCKGWSDARADDEVRAAFKRVSDRIAAKLSEDPGRIH